jgi:hypothetical protein
VNISRKHSPEKVREYFNLLKWHNNSQDQTLPQEVLDLDETLILYRNSLKYATKNIEIISLELESLAAQSGPLVDQLKHLERDLNSKKVEISDLYKLIVNINHEETTNGFADTNISRNEFDRKKASFLKIIYSIFLSIITDLKNSSLFSGKAVRKVLPKFLIIYTTILLTFAIGHNIILNWKNSFVFQTFCVLYFLVISVLIFALGEMLFKYVVQKYKELLPPSVSHDLKNGKYDKGNPISEIYKTVGPSEQDLNFRQLKSEKDQLDSHYSKIKQEYFATQFRIQQLQVELNKNKNATHDYEQLTVQRTSELIDLRYQHLSQLQEDVKTWLRDGISRITKNARNKLNIPENTDQIRRSTLTNKPLPLLTGILKPPPLDRKKNVTSYTIESDSTRNLEAISEEEIFIDENDFLSGIMLGSSTNRMFGVYEFVVIFLCSNFLTYYRCYFDLVKNMAIDEENCEYLYDSIVSVRVQYKSSTGQSDNAQKRTYRKRLFITTSDGNVVCFSVLQNRIRLGSSMRLSEVDEAAAAIRKMLRQRLVGLVRTEDRDRDNF